MNPTPHAPHPTTDAEQVPDNMFAALKDEVTHEVRHIQDNKEPVDTSQSDVLVQKHVTGLAISLFVLIAIVLLAAIGGIAWYAHSQKSGAMARPGIAMISGGDGTSSAFEHNRNSKPVVTGLRNPDRESLYREVRLSSYR